MRCPGCSNSDAVRGGSFPLRELREILAPQKYKCTRCSERWLAWPRLYCGAGPIGRFLRRIRTLIGGRGEWAPPT